MLDDRSMRQKAEQAYGPSLPGWIAGLADLADRVGLKETAARVNYSASTVSCVINNKYAGDLGAVEERARLALMDGRVDCPILGEIDRAQCFKEQDEPFRATSAQRVQLFHACQVCPNARSKGGKNA